MSVSHEEKALPAGAAGQVVHTATVWLRALPEPPTPRHDNLAGLKQYLAGVLGDPEAVAYCHWPVPPEASETSAPAPCPDAADYVSEVVHSLTRLTRPGQSPPVFGPQRAPLASLDAYRVIIGLPGRSLPTLIDWAPTPADPLGVSLSVGFMAYSGSTHIHLGLSLWSRTSVGFSFGWEETRDKDPRLRDVIHGYRRIGKRWQRSVNERFWTLPYTVGRRPYHPPVFWAMPESLLPDADADSPARICRELLSVSSLRAPSVHRSDIELDHCYSVHRRVNRNRTEVGGIRPLYLLTPRGEGTDEGIRQVVEVISRTEASLAHTAWDVENGVQMDRGLLLAYDAAAGRGSVLWDRLAMHIPVAGTRLLGRIHRQVRLLNQTLLQGVSDVEDVAKHVADSVSQLRATRAKAARSFHETLVEVSRADDGVGLYDEMVSTGYAADVDVALEEVTALSDRVRTRYSQLFQAVASAIEDRRAREFDVIQRFGFVIALALTAAVVSFSGAIVADMVDNANVPRRSLGVAALALLFLFGWQLTVMVLSTGPGIPRLTRQLRVVRRLMAESSTFELAARDSQLREELRRGGGSGNQSAYQARVDRWNSIDARLAAEVAAAWDKSVRTRFVPRGWWPVQPRLSAAARVGVRFRSPREDVTVLGDRLARWVLQTMLTTERPRRTFNPPLPRLCLLYRALELVAADPQWAMTGIGPAHSRWVSAVASPVGNQEVQFLFDQAFLDFTREQAEDEVRGLLEAVQGLSGRDGSRPSAVDVLEVIDARVRTWRPAET